MTAWRLISNAQRLLAWVVLALSGAYLLIYLYRWEWNRAIISGIFFVGAEVALVATALLRRMRALEQGLGAAQAPPSAALARLRSTPVDRPNPFGWLNPRDGRLGVFVPVLLGAGVILSAFAYVVERVAEATAVPVLDRQLARRMDGIAPPAGGLRGGGRVTGPTDTGGGRHHRAMVPVAWLLATGAIVVMAWLGISALMEATQTRADPADRPARTTIELSVAQRDAPGGDVAAVEALWIGCRSTLGSQRTVARFADRGTDQVALVLEPGIGRLTTRRLTGCLSDLRVNLVIATVTEVESTPPADT
jgi:hypothetical protein